uniref:kinesin-like protein KIN-12D n=1 Tax=Erigeron canadensis TaxID=72917 RepID=UPI001CB993A8|nr:kinesin-like protein KIN-12D [Erigeron canadensis]
MLRDTKLGRRISGKHLTFEETENVNPNHELSQNPKKSEQDSGFKSTKLFKTPTKQKSRNMDFGMSMRTPEKQGAFSRNRDEGRVGFTPRSCRTVGKVYQEANSTFSTPSKTVSRPPNTGLLYTGSSRPPVNGGGRTSNFTALSKGIPVTYNSFTTVNAVDVPHFELREDPSFWMDHNVQVMIRVRPLNGTEIRAQGYNRCLKQESAQSLTWVGHPETRFTFDHVACETINQETLFKMVGLPMVENCLSGYNSCMFAYGQTGSGKTHTMLGEINDLELKPSPYRGMTPRIFEFLFARITAEEESRKDERLVYSCKCSFLEIYNEQITDLLDPSTSNLQLREDVNNGVYVENLSEYEVCSVGDILKLLTQGSANRRVAATNMNRESSRSHSVFTCVIESRWEKDSTSNLRYARLNLVDLAGSERQKSSGAEGERLKEASSINKSLSTLGHVIMVLVDAAHARTQHVPYRDSKLTFLLQDSLGGNSKTMIIANVSPSISSAFETLSTLKFAQRAKLIQNNAVINEDASGDVVALKHQIRLLKQELALHKRYSISRSLAFSSKDENGSNTSSVGDDDKILRVSCQQLKALETSLNGALRRERSTENSIKHLEAEIEQLNCLIHQREEENRCTKMMLKFREDKIQRMESVLGGIVPVDSHLLEENNTLKDEIEILRAKVDKNPEVTRFAVENIRLLDQLKRYQDYCEEGEREMLLTEVSELRNQVILIHSQQENHMNPYMEKEAADDKKEISLLQSELKKSREELDKCRDNLNSCLEKNAILCREILELNASLEMKKSVQEGDIEVAKEPILESSSHGDQYSQKKNEILGRDKEEVVDLQLEIEILKIMLKEERSARGETEEKFLLVTKQCENLREELLEAQSVIEALEILQLASINGLEDSKNGNKQNDEILQNQGIEMTSLNSKNICEASKNHLENRESSLQEKLKKVQDSLEKAMKLNMWYQTDQAYHASNEEEMDEVRKQVEAETTDVIVCLQEELGSFQKQMDERILIEKETQQKWRQKCEEYDLLASEIAEVLSVSHKALDDASNQLSIVKERWVSEPLQIIARDISEKELRIAELNSCLEDAKSRCGELESMLRSLRGATLVMSEAHQQDGTKKDQKIDQLLSQLSEKDSIIIQLEEQIKVYEGELTDARLNAAQQAVESCCYHDKLVEIQNNNKEAGIVINSLFSENEAMKSDITELNSVRQRQIEIDTVGELRCLEEKLVTGFFAKETELFILSSKLEQVSLENNGLEKQIISMSAVLEKFKEEIIILVIDMQYKNSLLLEKDAEIGLLQNEIKMQKKAFEISSCKIQYELEAKAVELSNMRLEMDENESLIVMIRNQKDVVEALEYELYENIVKGQVLEAQLKELSRECKYSESLSSEIHFLKEDVEGILKAKELTEEQLSETKQVVERLEIEVLEIKIALDKKNTLVESLTGDLESVICERNDLYVELLRARKEVEMTDAFTQENEAIATKAEQLYELEITDAKVLAAQYAVESSCYLDKFVETQNSIIKADLIIKKLISENEKMKIDIAALKGKEVAFMNENDMLKDSYSLLEKQLKLEVEELECMILHIQATVDEDLMAMTSGFLDVKSRFHDTNKSVQTWCEEIWSEIIAKGWAISILHVCYMGVLKESVSGFSAENSLLYHDLCVSHSLVSQLSEHNGNSRRELEACSFIQGRLLTDIKNSYDRISSIEEEAEKLSIKVTSCEKKIQDLQVLDEAMLKWSTRMGHDLSMLMKEVTNENNEDLRCLEEKTVTDLSAKEIEVLIMLSKLEQMASESHDLQKEFEKSKQYASEKEEEVKLYEKSVEELESTISVLENQVNMVKADAERQRLKREELELELQKVQQKEQLLTMENESIKTENANHKTKLIELEDEVKKLSGQQNLQQRIHHLAKIKEENNVLKKQNDEISLKLRRAEAIVARVKEELANLRANGKSAAR